MAAPGKLELLLAASRNWQLIWKINELLAAIAEDSTRLLDFDSAALFLIDRSGLSLRAAYPVDAAAPSDSEGLALARRVVESGRPLFQRCDLSSTRLATQLCAPLHASRGMIGALSLQSHRPERSVTGADQEFLDALALQAAAAIDHALVYQAAITDPLTQLYCHRHFQQEVEQAVRRARRSESSLALLLMDLDHFKALNDACGHAAGNACLVQVADLLRASFRCTDILARFGGDEFEILLPDTKGDDAFTLAERLRVKIAALRFEGERQVGVTLGVALFPDHGSDAQTLFLRADEALYQAKEAGRNRTLLSNFRAPAGAAPQPSARGVVEPAVPAQMPAVTSQADLSPERKIDGHQVVKRLGSGSSGEVLLVHQPELDRDVALKRPLLAQLSPEQLGAFEREAKVTAGLYHPGVVPIFTMGRDFDGRRYYTMKPVAGRTLREILQARAHGDLKALRQYSSGRLLEILQRVAETIAYAHQQRVAHLDLNPANILVGDFGEVTVIDWGTNSSSFGRSRASAAAQPMTVLGSPAYSAPEVLSGSVSSSGCELDVYAMGAMLYEVLASRPPHHDSTCSTQELLQRIVSSDPLPPERVAPDAGVDPSLSSLSLAALSRRREARPSAAEFSERLSMYTRRETQWTLTRFGVERPMSEDDWEVVEGNWTLVNDVWSCNGLDAILLWRVPVPGSFRLVCEVWAERLADLGLIGHRPGKDFKNFARHSGYYFEFGAEGNSCTKLARQEFDVLARRDLRVEPGRRYRLELEWQDEEGLLHCAIDDQRVFSYREMYPFPGVYLGLYGFGKANFRPIELHQQNWTLQLPAIRAADRHYQYGHYSEALEFYREIQMRLPNRNEGLEAQLKAAVCLAHLGRRDEAREQLARLAGTPLAPFALEEFAVLDFERQRDSDPWRGIALFERLRARFPNSRARTGVLSALKKVMSSDEKYGKSFSEHVCIGARLGELAAAACTPPVHSQIQARFSATKCLMRQGRWQEAYDRQVEFGLLLTENQRAASIYLGPVLVTGLATGKQDAPLPIDSILTWRDVKHFAFRDLLTFALAQPQDRQSFLGRTLPQLKPPEHPTSVLYAALLALLIEGRPAEARQFVRDCMLLPKQSTDFQDALYLLTALAHWQDAELLALEIERMTGLSLKPQELDELTRMFNGKLELERGALTGAARWLGPMTGSIRGIRDVYVMQALLASLGELPLGELEAKCQHELAGPELRLSEIFFGKRPPVPDETWPAPLWKPEWRLWLALWLEAKGQAVAALEIISPAKDSRFGLSHCQPAIEALWQRLAK